MIYDLKDPDELDKFNKRVEQLRTKPCRVELIKIGKKRSTEQNSYLHLMLTWYAVHQGSTLAEAKSDYKRLNREIYVYKKRGNYYIRSSADLSTTETEQCNKLFRHHAIQNLDFYIPEPNEQGYHKWVNEVNAAKKTNYQFLMSQNE